MAFPEFRILLFATPVLAIFIIFWVAANGGTPARAALRWVCGLGFGWHGRECVVLAFIIQTKRTADINLFQYHS